MSNTFTFGNVLREVASAAGHPAVQLGIIAVTALAQASTVMNRPTEEQPPALPTSMAR